MLGTDGVAGEIGAAALVAVTLGILLATAGTRKWKIHFVRDGIIALLEGVVLNFINDWGNPHREWFWASAILVLAGAFIISVRWPKKRIAPPPVAYPEGEVVISTLASPAGTPTVLPLAAQALVNKLLQLAFVRAVVLVLRTEGGEADVKVRTVAR